MLNRIQSEREANQSCKRFRLINWENPRSDEHCAGKAAGSRRPDAAGEDASEHRSPKRAIYKPIKVTMYADFDAMSPCVENYCMDTHAHIHNDIRAGYFLQHYL